MKGGFAFCLEMFDMHGILRQTFLVIVATFALVALGHANHEIAFNPPSLEYDPTTFAVGDVIQCTAYGEPVPTTKWYNINWDVLSESSELNVTEDMRHWRQPVTLHCHVQLDTQESDGYYTFLVAGAVSSGVVDVIFGISFYPHSSAEAPTTIGVGSIIQCMAIGVSLPTIRWWHGDELDFAISGCGEMYVTEDMRHWKQPITLKCQMYSRLNFPYVMGNYTFQVAGAEPCGIEAWVIAVAVIVPIVVMAAAGIAYFFINRRCERKKTSTAKTAK